MSDHRQTHADNEQEEETERVSSGIQNGDHEKESEGGCTSAVLVNIAVVCELGEHFDDEKDNGAGDVILHRANRDCQSMFAVPHAYIKAYRSSRWCLLQRYAHPHPRTKYTMLKAK